MAEWASPCAAWSNPSFESWREAMIAPPTEPFAPATARSGTPDGNSDASRLVYRDVATLPMTATPSVPPKSRGSIVDGRSHSRLRRWYRTHDRFGGRQR